MSDSPHTDSPESEKPATETKTAEERHAERINALPWQRWKPGDLRMPVFTTPDEPLLADGEEEQDDGQPKVQVDQNELLNLQRRAEQQGFQQGQEAGLQQALQEGQQQQAVLTEHWQHMVSDFQQTLDALDSVIASRLMQMALTAAKQIIGQAPICDGSALLNQIQQLIQQEPMFKGKPQLRVNPADFERVKLQLGASLSMNGWRLLADSQIHSGGCKVSAEDGDMDASLATRWHELCRLAAPGDL